MFGIVHRNCFSDADLVSGFQGIDWIPSVRYVVQHKRFLPYMPFNVRKPARPKQCTAASILNLPTETTPKIACGWTNVTSGHQIFNGVWIFLVDNGNMPFEYVWVGRQKCTINRCAVEIIFRTSPGIMDWMRRFMHSPVFCRCELPITV